MPENKSSAKARPMQQKDEDSLVYVRLAEPMGTRKAVLNLALDTIQLLKKYDSVRSISMRKQVAKQKLAKTYNEIRRLALNVKMKELPGTAKPSAKEERPAMPKIEVAKSLARPKRELGLSPLEKEMEAIRNKLANL